MAEKEHLKQRINEGEVIVGAIVGWDTGSDRLKEILDQYPYDFFSLDSQHSPFSEEKLVDFCNMVDTVGADIHFRIKHTRHSYLIGNILDLGPTLIEVPQVENVATVYESIEHFYFPPVARRSWIGGASKGFGERGSDRIAYANWWNTYGVLWMQIESINAITNVRKIAKQGVDCVSWGPADLSFSRESNPDHPFKTDEDCVKYVVDQLEGTGIRLAYRSYDPALRDKYIDMGATVLLEVPN
jgi:2-keto-3-deoxy-L-rhamnonate aldolase RhmA